MFRARQKHGVRQYVAYLLHCSTRISVFVRCFYALLGQIKRSFPPASHQLHHRAQVCCSYKHARCLTFSGQSEVPPWRQTTKFVGSLSSKRDCSYVRATYVRLPCTEVCTGCRQIPWRLQHKTMALFSWSQISVMVTA